jgi:hypothetical protein
LYLGTKRVILRRKNMSCERVRRKKSKKEREFIRRKEI